MNYRDLLQVSQKASLTQHYSLQRRITDHDGNTGWENSPLIVAAISGETAILDNVDRLQKDALASLQSLIIDHSVILPDGTRLVHHDHFESLMDHYSADELELLKIHPVHPNFRVIAVGGAIHYSVK